MKRRRHVLFLIGQYYSRLHHGVIQFAKEHNWYLTDNPTLSHRVPKGWEGDGVIFGLSGKPDWLHFFNALTVPKVMISRPPTDFGTSFFYSDPQSIAQIAADYYLSLGFKNFAVYSRNGLMHQRFKSFIEILDAQGYQCLKILPEKQDMNWRKRNEWIGEMLSEAKYPIAVFTDHDPSSVDVIDACLERGISVPEQVAVLGVDNNEFTCELSSVPLSSIDSNQEEQGYRAAAELEKLMNGETRPATQNKIPGLKVITRRSTDIIAVEHPDLSKALSFIRDNYQANIGIEDIVNATSLSRRGLFFVFRKYLNRTPGDEVQRLRMKSAEDMLKESDKKVKRIAIESGFGDYNTFYQAFIKKHSVTPKQFRKL